MSLDLLQTSREAKKVQGLGIAITESLEGLENPNTIQMIIFTPFKIACRSGIEELQTIAIDCLGKLFAYQYWKRSEAVPLAKTAFPLPQKKQKDKEKDDTGVFEDDHEVEEVVNQMNTYAINTICESFEGESTAEKVQLQIIKALQQAANNEDQNSVLHGAGLLKVIRTIYNIFLLSLSAEVQEQAQNTVSQMIQNVFSKVPCTTQKLLHRHQSKKMTHSISGGHTKKARSSSIGEESKNGAPLSQIKDRLEPLPSKLEPEKMTHSISGGHTKGASSSSIGEESKDGAPLSQIKDRLEPLPSKLETIIGETTAE
jgi:brefeldin A-inhibited guanine nucleotide-exchange protein